MKNKFLWSIVIFAIAFLNVEAQNAKKLLEEYTTKFPDSRYIILNKTKHMIVDLVDGKVKITERSSEENFYLDEDAGYLTDDKISFSSFSKIAEIEAKSYLPKGKRFKVKKVKDFKIEDEFSRGIFHDDAKSMNFSYPGLQKGSKTTLTYTKVINQPRFLGGFYFIAPVPTLEQQYILEVHPDVEIDIKNFNTENVDIDFKKSTKNGKNIYTWKLDNAPKFEVEEKAPKISYYAPHVIPHITKYTVDGKTEKILSNPTDLFNWYNSLIKNVNSKSDDVALKKLVDEITEGAKTDLEKVKRIYYWTQENIKYIAFEEGMDGFIPRDTDQVIDQKYGDCKDMSTCIFTLLDYAKVPASVCWIGTDDIPYSYNELPTPAVDNHMIAAYNDNGNYYFLDATSEHTPFGKPSSFIQGKEAMVKVGDEAFELVKVPIVDAKDNSKTEKSKLKLVGNKLVGNATTNINGYLKTNLTYRLTDEDKEDQFKIFSKYLKRGSNKFLLDDFNLQHEFDKEKSTKISYNFNIEDYVFVNKDETYINLNFYEWYKGNKIKENRKVPIRRKHKVYYNIVNEFEIPKNHEVTFVPKDLKLKNELFSFESIYKVEGNKIIHTEEVVEDFIQLEPKDFARFNKFIATIDEYISQTIILKKK